MRVSVRAKIRAKIRVRVRVRVSSRIVGSVPSSPIFVAPAWISFLAVQSAMCRTGRDGNLTLAMLSASRLTIGITRTSLGRVGQQYVPYLKL